jgi:hypothetical protein
MNYRDVVNTALKEVGYQGGSKTSKYSEYLDKYNYYNSKKNGACTWCAIFVDYCVFINNDNKVYETQEIVCEDHKDNCGAGCTQHAQYYKNKGRWISKHSDATTGDQIFFKKSNGQIYHTGIVVDWDKKGFYTVEGSTDGGKVSKRFYAYGDSKIAGFGRPDWYKYDVPKTETHVELIKRLAKECIEGKYGNGLTRKQKINGLGYGSIYSEVQNCVNMILRGQI